MCLNIISNSAKVNYYKGHFQCTGTWFSRNVEDIFLTSDIPNKLQRAVTKLASTIKDTGSTMDPESKVCVYP